MNGRTAMIGFMCAIFSYALTGKLFFGIVWWDILLYLLLHCSLSFQ
jgi:hypothetical protein